MSDDREMVNPAAPTLRPAVRALDEGVAFAGYLATAAEGFFRAMLMCSLIQA